MQRIKRIFIAKSVRQGTLFCMPRIVSVYASSAKKRDTSGNLCFVCGADAYDKLRVLLAGR